MVYLQRCLVVTWLVLRETDAVSAGVLCVVSDMVSNFKQSHIRRVHECLAVTCHLHFWQNDRDRYVLLQQYAARTDTEIRVSTES